MIDLDATISAHIRAIEGIRPLVPRVREVARDMTRCLVGGGKILWMGNGGSAADCQHLSAELVARFSRERPGLASLALTSNPSILTAVGNDYGHEAIFVRQVDALCQAGDVVIGLSTSGESRNVLTALQLARERGAGTVALTGGEGGPIVAAADHGLIVPSMVTARIQEAHVVIGHMLCDLVEAEFVQPRGDVR